MKNFRWFLICLSVVAGFFVNPANAALTIGNYTLMSKQRVSRTDYHYTFQADITNSGESVLGVTAELTTSSPNTTVVEGALSFGDVASQSSQTSLDTFTVRQNRRYPFDPESLQWNISFTPATATVTGKAVAGVPVVGTINLKDSRTPPNTSFSAINADGSYTLQIDSQWQPPFLMYAEGWVNNKHLRLLSCFDLEPGVTETNVNTTPATTAIVESAMGTPVEEIDPLTVPIPPIDTVEQIQAQVEETLQDLFSVIGLPSDFNLFASVIGEVGSPSDQIFDALSFDTDDDNNVVVADANDNSQQVVVDPNGPVAEVPQEMLDSVGGTNDALTQIRNIMEGFYEMFQEGQRPDRDLLESVLLPNLAVGFLNHGYGRDDFITVLADNDNSGPVNESFVGCGLLRPMATQYYGVTTVEENHDGYPDAVWVNVTSSINGLNFMWLTAFVMEGDGTWKWYGNRRPMRRTTWGRPRARQILFPSGAVYYQSGLDFWHNDLGNLALSRGISNLAIFNPAFAPETIHGIDTNCVRLERREQGIDTRYRLSNVPVFGTNDHLYRIGIDRGLDLDALNAQESKEFVVIGLDDNDRPVRTWLYTIGETPHTLNEIVANPGNYFASIDRATVSFDLYDPNDPNNPNAFPGEAGLFSWALPSNPELFTSWTYLGWSDNDWNWNELQIDNPAWNAPGDFFGWTDDTYLPGPTATSVREAEFNVTVRNANASHYQTRKEYNRWADDFISVENGELVFDMQHAYAPENISDQLKTRTRIRDGNTTRLEAQVQVDSASLTGPTAYAETEVSIAYQPREDFGRGETNFIYVVARIRYYNNQLFLMGFVWGSYNADGTDDFYVLPMSGDYPPEGFALNFNQPYTLAVEYDAPNNRLVVEFDDGSGPLRGYFDADNSDLFDPANLQYAEIRTRVRGLNQAGDSGSMRVRYDDVLVNGQPYDNFDNGFALNKWQILASE